MAKQTKVQAKAPAPSAVADLLKSAPKPAAANGAVSEEAVLKYIASLERGSETLRRARNAVWARIQAADVDPEIKGVLAEIIRLKGFEPLRVAYLDARRQHQPVKRKAKEEKEAVS